MVADDSERGTSDLELKSGEEAMERKREELKSGDRNESVHTYMQCESKGSNEGRAKKEGRKVKSARKQAEARVARNG